MNQNKIWSSPTLDNTAFMNADGEHRHMADCQKLMNDYMHLNRLLASTTNEVVKERIRMRMAAVQNMIRAAQCRQTASMGFTGESQYMNAGGEPPPLPLPNNLNNMSCQSLLDHYNYYHNAFLTYTDASPYKAMSKSAMQMISSVMNAKKCGVKANTSNPHATGRAMGFTGGEYMNDDGISHGANQWDSHGMYKPEVLKNLGCQELAMEFAKVKTWVATDTFTQSVYNNYAHAISVIMNAKKCGVKANTSNPHATGHAMGFTGGEQSFFGCDGCESKCKDFTGGQMMMDGSGGCGDCKGGCGGSTNFTGGNADLNPVMSPYYSVDQSVFQVPHLGGSAFEIPTINAFANPDNVMPATELVQPVEAPLLPDAPAVAQHLNPAPMPTPAPQAKPTFIQWLLGGMKDYTKH